MRLIFVIALLTLICGCATTCKEPMKSVEGVCCIDANDNKVCDSVENVTEAVCNPPYMEYNGSCCRDTNGNHVCDKQEAANDMPSAMIIPTRMTTSTTVTAQPEVNDTTTTTSTTTSSTSTTSTTHATSTTMPVCYDSDRGENKNVKGMVSGLDRAPPHERVNATDYCRYNNIMEYRCSGDYVYAREMLCDSFQVCQEGRSCLSKGSKCASRSECCSGECITRVTTGLCY